MKRILFIIALLLFVSVDFLHKCQSKFMEGMKGLYSEKIIL